MNQPKILPSEQKGEKEKQDEEGLLERQTEQTYPTSTMFLWQKQAARKSTDSCEGRRRSLRRGRAGRKVIFARDEGRRQH